MSSIFLLLTCCFLQYVKSDIPEDANFNFTQIAKKYGHECEEFDVVTEDGYISTLFHIKGNKYYPVLLGHGILDSAMTFIIRGSRSLALTLARKGYDVWALNVRGTTYGRRHVSLKPDTDKEYWNFSFHEMGVKDVPANIDFVLNKTNQTQLIYIGHSQGTQMTFVTLSMKPEYNAKIKLCVALAPIGYLHSIKFPAITIPSLWSAVKLDFIITGTEEVKAPELFQKICQTKDIGYELCMKGLVFTFSGSDPPELESEFMPILFKHYPTATSRKNIDHLTQVVKRKKFGQYDYGSSNLQVYDTIEPPDYPVEKITARVLLLVGRNDKLSDPTDVKLLEARLPNAIYHEIEREAMNHIDFTIGKNMKDYLFPVIFKALLNYTHV